MGMSGSPFNDDVMTIIMGIEPSEPGMHGPCEMPGPTDDAVSLVTKIRDMCDKWLRSAGKGDGDTPKPEKPEKPDEADEPLPDDREEL